MPPATRGFAMQQCMPAITARYRTADLVRLLRLILRTAASLPTNDDEVGYLRSNDRTAKMPTRGGAAPGRRAASVKQYRRILRHGAPTHQAIAELLTRHFWHNEKAYRPRFVEAGSGPWPLCVCIGN